jgi:two-component system sensor histidine kinase KdpD
MLTLHVRHPFVTAILSVSLAIGLLELVGPTNGATAAQVLLLVVLIDARFCGSRSILVAAPLAAAAFTRYFLTPEGFAYGNPDDWASLFAFVTIATVGFELAARAERRAQEVEHLYAQLQMAFERESEAEAARRNERLKATLLDAMSHNLRTPLTAIKMSVTAMIGSESWQPTSALNSDEQRELLQVIDEESDRLNRLVGGLVTSADGDGAEPSTLRPVRVADIVAGAIARAETLTRDHTVVVATSDGLPSVAVERSSMIEVIYMLLDNASKYSPPNTRIDVACRRLDAHYVAMSVADQGPGIPVDVRDRVFDKFFQIPGREVADRARRGAGLGLSIARRLVQMQGGRIWVETPPWNYGACFVVALPIAAGSDEGDGERGLAVAGSETARDLNRPALESL